MSVSGINRRIFSCILYLTRKKRDFKLTSVPFRSKHSSSPLNNDICSQYHHRSSRKLIPLFGTGILCAYVAYKFHKKLPFSVQKFGFNSIEAAEIDNDDRSRSHQFNFVADVVEKAAPSVVYIESKGRHPFDRSRLLKMCNGSGFIVREDGLILTNAHVVANKEVVIVTLQDGQQFNGKVQAVDQVTDLATVKINAKDLPALKLGKSLNVRPGEWVIAMGSPLSLSNTVTCGIVSSVHRGSKELGLRNKDMAYIQTDAVINYGNSGGPLVNLEGEAIGINTMKVTTGISFAIPSDIAADFLQRAEKLMKRNESRGWFTTGKVQSKKRRYIGVSLLTLTPSLIIELQERIPDFPDNVQGGVLVQKIILGSPAHNAGVQTGDIIVKVDGNEVKSAADVFSAVESGDIVRINIVRRNRSLMVNVVPEDVE